MKSGGWDRLRVNLEFWVFCFIPLLLAVPNSSLPPLLGGFSPVCIHWVGVTLVQFRVVSLIMMARIWKLSRTYPGEKPPSLSVPKQTHTALAGNAHYLSRNKCPFRGSNGPLSSTYPGTTTPSFPRFFYLFIFENMLKWSKVSINIIQQSDNFNEENTVDLILSNLYFLYNNIIVDQNTEFNEILNNYLEKIDDTIVRIK